MKLGGYPLSDKTFRKFLRLRALLSCVLHLCSMQSISFRMILRFVLLGIADS